MLTFQEFCEKADHLKRVLIDPSYRFESLGTRGFYNDLSDEEYLKRMFKARMGYELDLSNPQTFNEKLQWLKFHDHNPLYTTMVDKYAVKEYVASIIGEQYIIPTLGVWERFEDINFDSLPSKFVLKCTHDSGGLVIVKDKNHLNLKAARKKINRSLSRNYFYVSREWPYKNVKARIIAEQYLNDPSAEELIDYKFLCFDGEVKCSFVCTDRYSKDGLHVTFFDKDWNVMPFIRHYPKSKTFIPKPKCYEEMVSLAECLSKGIPFVRIDLYENNGNVKFGEYTFYPGSGYEEFMPEEWDYKIGEWLHLPERCV